MRKVSAFISIVCLPIVSTYAASIIVNDFGVAESANSSNVYSLETSTAGNYLVVAVTSESPLAYATAATFMGQGMTQLAFAESSDATSGYQNYTSIWGIATTSTGGTNSLSISTFSTNITTDISYLFLDNVDTSSPLLGSASEGALSGASTTLNYSADPEAGSLVFVATNLADNTVSGAITYTPEPAEGQSLEYVDTSPSIVGLYAYYTFESAETDYSTAVAFGAGGNDRYASAGVVLKAIPEPGTYAMIAGALCLVLAAIRRRQNR